MRNFVYLNLVGNNDRFIDGVFTHFSDNTPWIIARTLHTCSVTFDICTRVYGKNKFKQLYTIKMK